MTRLPSRRSRIGVALLMPVALLACVDRILAEREMAHRNVARTQTGSAAMRMG